MVGNSILTITAVALVVAAIALAALERVRFGPFSAIPRLDSDPAPLRHAAELAYDYAKRCRLPLAAVAERKSSQDAANWFENSLLKTVPVSATWLKTGRVKLVARRMCAVSDGIAESAEGEAVFGDPTVSARAFRTYLLWARSVW